VRNKPEQYGLQPDGIIAPLVDNTSTAAEIAEENWTLPEARRTPIFWVFMLGMASISMLSTGLFFHMVSIFNDNGLSATVAASAFVPIAATTAIVNVISGILIDRIRIRWLMAIALLLQAATLIIAQSLPSVQVAFIYGIMLGTMFGLMNMVNSVSWAKYYGRKHLGSITGVTTTVLIAGSALGPMPFGIARDLLGSYNLALTIAALIPLTLGIASMFVDRPQKSDPE
jgi:cyanate permease